MALRPDLHCAEIMRVIGSPTARFAICKCGWKGPERGTLECVVDDALQHEESDMGLTLRHKAEAIAAEALSACATPGTAPPTEPAGGPLTTYPIEIRNAVTRYAERRHMLRFSASDDGGSHFTVQWADLGAARFPYSLAGLCDACGWIDGLLLRDVGALDPAGREALILELSTPLSPAAKVRILDDWHGEVSMAPVDVLEYMADLAALLPYQRSEHSAKPDLSLGVSAEAYALVRSIPGCVDLTASECGPGEAWARIGVLGVGATEPSQREATIECREADGTPVYGQRSGKEEV